MYLLRLFIDLKRRSINFLINNIKYFRFIKEQQNLTQKITFQYWFNQKVRGINRNAYWPVHKQSLVVETHNILVGKGSFPGYMPGCYIQGIGKIYIGKYSIFSANVGVISANHSIYNNTEHIISEIHIGSYCWVGMNAMILPGVILGDYTVVAAGAVVTKSFPKGFCVIGGNPAKVIKELDKEKCSLYEIDSSIYRGYIREDKFISFAKKNLNFKEIK